MTTRALFLMTTLCAALAAACAGGDDDGGGGGGGGGGAVCGDSMVGAGEQCDDGNTTDGDGCSSTCQDEGGGGGDPVCGDGAIDAGEACDDGGTDPGDGCDDACAVEDGWTCDGEPSVCTEDQPLVPDGSCAAPFVVELVDDQGVLTGTATGDTTGGADQVGAESCDGGDAGAGPDHIWQFTIAEPSDVVVFTDETTPFDEILRLSTAPCDVGTEIPEFQGADGCSDLTFGGDEGLGYVALEPGTYYVTLDGFDADAFGAYSFTVIAQATTCGDGVVDALEFCDDGDRDDGDGCDARCEVEGGFTCDQSEPSVCTPDAGDAPVAGDLVLNEYMAADNASDTNCDQSTTGTRDEFVELVNVSDHTLDLTGITVADSVITRHVFGALSLPAGEAVVVWGGGTPACEGVTRFQIASTGQLGLNDGGDTITIADAGGAPLVEVTYAAATANVSDNLSPDVTGADYALHTDVAGAVGSFSPGRRVDGTAF